MSMQITIMDIVALKCVTLGLGHRFRVSDTPSFGCERDWLKTSRSLL